MRSKRQVFSAGVIWAGASVQPASDHTSSSNRGRGQPARQASRAVAATSAPENTDREGRPLHSGSRVMR